MPRRTTSACEERWTEGRKETTTSQDANSRLLETVCKLPLISAGFLLAGFLAQKGALGKGFIIMYKVAGAKGYS